MENTDLIRIMDYKFANPNAHASRNIRYVGEEEYNNIFTEINSNEIFKSMIKKEYFPNTLEDICQTEMVYDANEDGAIKNLLIWGSYLLENYADEVNKYLRYRDCYEGELFNGNYKAALKWIKAIEREISVSLWGKQQEFLVLNLQNQPQKVDLILNDVEKYISSNMIALLMHLYSKMSESDHRYIPVCHSFGTILTHSETVSPSGTVYNP